MCIAAGTILAAQITAVFASGGDHTTKHAHWGFYMIAAVAIQIFTGFMRTKGLEAKHANFSFVHRVGGWEGGRAGSCQQTREATIMLSSFVCVRANE